jgi:hypothetical protein
VVRLLLRIHVRDHGYKDAHRNDADLLGWSVRVDDAHRDRYLGLWAEHERHKLRNCEPRRLVELQLQQQLRRHGVAVAQRRHADVLGWLVRQREFDSNDRVGVWQGVSVVCRKELWQQRLRRHLWGVLGQRSMHRWRVHERVLAILLLRRAGRRRLWL